MGWEEWVCPQLRFGPSQVQRGPSRGSEPVRRKGKLLPALVPGSSHSVFQRRPPPTLTGLINLFLLLLCVTLQVLDVSQFRINRVYYAVAWSGLLWATSARQLNGQLAALALQPEDELLLWGFSVVFLLSFPPHPPSALPTFSLLFLMLFFGVFLVFLFF